MPATTTSTNPTSTNASFAEWLRQGEMLHAMLLKEYQDLERQIQELQKRRAAKAAEVNEIARILGRGPIEGSPRRVEADLLTPGELDRLDDDDSAVVVTAAAANLGAAAVVNGEVINPAAAAAANASIARALSGKFSNGPLPGAAAATGSPKQVTVKMIDTVPLRRG